MPAVKTVPCQDPAGDIAAHSAEAVDIHRLSRIQLIEVCTELTQRNIDKAIDTAFAVLTGFPDIQQRYGGRIQLLQILPVEYLDFSGDYVFGSHACYVDRILCRGIGRRIAELQITELGDRHTRTDGGRQHIGTFIRTFGTEELSSQDFAGVFLKQELNGDHVRAGIITSVAAQVQMHLLTVKTLGKSKLLRHAGSS